jgi:hypothetical protein
MLLVTLGGVIEVLPCAAEPTCMLRLGHTRWDCALAAKYQVFVSSTYGDLKDERDRVIQGILELGHIPVGMEMFSAADEEQWQIIARHIEESDYYVVIVAHRYGSLVGDISFTRKEYEYALAVGVPVIGFVIDPEALWPGDRVDKDAVSIQRLKSFKELVEAKPVGYWRTADELYGQASVALVKTMAAQPRTGWVRASSALGPEVTAEISRLSAENAALRAEITELAASTNRVHDAELDGLWARLYQTSWEHSVRITRQSDWEQAIPLPLGQWFMVFAPNMMVEASVSVIDDLILTNSRIKDHLEDRPAAVARNERNAMLADFMTLDLMEPSLRRHPVADSSEYWALTERGRELLKRRKLMLFEHSWNAGTPRDEESSDIGSASSVETTDELHE